MSDQFISIEGIARRFSAPGGGSTTVFEDLWLSMARGEFVCVIGHSGCGKTTVLNILAGLDRPAELSGGMKQRVGIARALSIQPKIMLMDEPFSALDALTRGTLQDEVRRICLETGQTAFMITHDVDEAIYLADKIVLMTNGPGAVLAEIVENPLPKNRERTEVHRHPLYYAVRNHIIDFLIERSRTFVSETPGFDPRHVPVVRPGVIEQSGKRDLDAPPRLMAAGNK
jgi:nitrate/nitrite transport system ATP-binding protein